MPELQFRTVLEPAGPAIAVILTDDQVAELGPTKNPPVVLTIGDVSVRVRVARMGGRNMIGLNKQNRAALSVAAGDEVDAIVALDDAERTVEIPPELAAALAADPEAQAAFDTLSFTHRREHAEAVAGAKKPETKARRVAKTLEMLRGETR